MRTTDVIRRNATKKKARRKNLAQLTLFCRVAMNVGSIYFKNHIAGFNLQKDKRKMKILIKSLHNEVFYQRVVNSFHHKIVLCKLSSDVAANELFFKMFLCCATHKQTEILIRTMSCLYNSEILREISCMIISRLTYIERVSSVKIDKTAFICSFPPAKNALEGFFISTKPRLIARNSLSFAVKFVFFRRICRYLSSDNKTRSM